MKKELIATFVILLVVIVIALIKIPTNVDVVANATVSIFDVANGESVTIIAQEVWRTINGSKVKMYAYNNLIPGVTLRVNQGSTIMVNFVNEIDQETTIHWHGLRHDVKDDGVPGISQDPIQPGESFEYTLYFPDEGIYWYHPHVREDIQQDKGLAGNMIVIPRDLEYYNVVNREELLLLDDILMENGKIVPFGKEHANFALMGRYGNVMLVNGQTDYNLNVNLGEVIRFYVTNVANVRPFNLSFGGAKIKLIGSDIGKYEHETFVDSVVIAPAERYIVEVFFGTQKEYFIENINPHKTTKLGIISVQGELSKIQHFKTFPTLKENKGIIKDIDNFRKYFNKSVDYQIDLTVDMDDLINIMSLLPCHSMGGIVMGDCTDKERKELEEELEHEELTIEWEDEMGEVSSQFTSKQLTWVLEDHVTKKQNKNISLTAKVGDKIKIRFFNDPESQHTMQHPIHLHGQRFLVISIDDQPVENLGWKDTVLVPIGSTIDILVDVTNPGEWVMHCHISEHLESGMVTSLLVTET